MAQAKKVLVLVVSVMGLSGPQAVLRYGMG